MTIEIPGYKILDIRHVVLDYNGTIAKDGGLSDDVKELVRALSLRYGVHVVTADTFGTVAKELEGLQVKMVVLQSGDHTQEKAAFVASLGAENCAAVGNGSNDAAMLETAALGIAVMGEEGCSALAMKNADVLTRHIADAVGLLLHPKRLVATLRR
jgi:soluble P-type ATPase